MYNFNNHFISLIDSLEEGSINSENQLLLELKKWESEIKRLDNISVNTKRNMLIAISIGKHSCEYWIKNPDNNPLPISPVAADLGGAIGGFITGMPLSGFAPAYVGFIVFSAATASITN